MKHIIVLSFVVLAICSCKPSENKEEQIPIVIEDTTFLVKKSLAAINFYALGQEPFWSINLLQDSIVQFTPAPDAAEIKLQWQEQQQIGGIKRYTLEGDGQRLTITIRPDSCQDTMSGQMFDHIVTAAYRNSDSNSLTNYTGCGEYVPDYRLTGRWELEMVQGNIIHQENGLRETPYLNISPFDKSFDGNAGCNNISGSLAIEGERLFFSNIRTTRMACPSPLEETLVQALGRVSRFTIKKNQLVLYQEDQQLAIYNRTKPQD